MSPDLLLHVPACYVIGALAKEHPKVADTSNGARGFEGMFFGCYCTTPMVKVWVPKLQRMVAMRDVRIYDDRKPFVTACLHDHTGMTKSELAALHNPVRPQPARVTTRTTPVTPIAVDVGTQTQQVVPPATALANCHDLITEAKDAALAHFVAERQKIATSACAVQFTLTFQTCTHCRTWCLSAPNLSPSPSAGGRQQQPMLKKLRWTKAYGQTK